MSAKDDFTRKEFVRSHEIGEYEIIEYYPPSEDGYGFDYDAVRYMPYVNGIRTNQFFYTLDSALLYALGFKYCGDNSQFTHFASRMLGIY